MNSLSLRDRWRYMRVLGLQHDTFTESTLRKAYRTRALQSHPDKKGNECDFSQVNEAYTALERDLENRKKLRNFVAGTDVHKLGAKYRQSDRVRTRKQKSKRYDRSCHTFNHGAREPTIVKNRRMDATNDTSFDMSRQESDSIYTNIGHLFGEPTRGSSSPCSSPKASPPDASVNERLSDDTGALPCEREYSASIDCNVEGARGYAADAPIVLNMTLAQVCAGARIRQSLIVRFPCIDCKRRVCDMHFSMKPGTVATIQYPVVAEWDVVPGTFASRARVYRVRVPIDSMIAAKSTAAANHHGLELPETWNRRTLESLRAPSDETRVSVPVYTIDVYSAVRDVDDGKFSRDDSNNLHCSIKVPLSQALTGIDMDVITPRRRVVRVSTRSGRTLNQRCTIRVAGEGIPLPRYTEASSASNDSDRTADSEKNSDFFVKLQIDMPDYFDDECHDELDQLRDILARIYEKHSKVRQAQYTKDLEEALESGDGERVELIQKQNRVFETAVFTREQYKQAVAVEDDYSEQNAGDTHSEESSECETTGAIRPMVEMHDYDFCKMLAASIDSSTVCEANDYDSDSGDEDDRYSTENFENTVIDEQDCESRDDEEEDDDDHEFVVDAKNDAIAFNTRSRVAKKPGDEREAKRRTTRSSTPTKRKRRRQ